MDYRSYKRLEYVCAHNTVTKERASYPFWYRRRQRIHNFGDAAIVAVSIGDVISVHKILYMKTLHWYAIQTCLIFTSAVAPIRLYERIIYLPFVVCSPMWTYAV